MQKWYLIISNWSWETIWFCVLIMKTHSFKDISITYMFLLGHNFPSFKIIHLVGWNHHSGRMCMWHTFMCVCATLKINTIVPQFGKILLARLFSVGFNFSFENYWNPGGILHMFAFSSIWNNVLRPGVVFPKISSLLLFTCMLWHSVGSTEKQSTSFPNICLKILRETTTTFGLVFLVIKFFF